MSHLNHHVSHKEGMPMLSTAQCIRRLSAVRDTQLECGLTSIPSVRIMEVTLAQQDPWHSRWQYTVRFPTSCDILIGQKK